MNRKPNCLLTGAAWILTGTLLSLSASNSPRLEKQGTATRLILEGKPFLMIGGKAGQLKLPAASRGECSSVR
ncbi:hypothetical protein JW948_14230 [bacterium]|nr:hypothetical protein [bacterium]